jgi:hypothetical protein
MGLREKISKEAYEIYEKNGKRQGTELLDWLAAEKIIQFEQMILPVDGVEFMALLEYRSINDRAAAAPVAGKAKHRSNRANKSKTSAGAGGISKATGPQHAHR